MPREQPPVQEFISRENISRWTAQLADTGDERQRETLRRLIETERQHLLELRNEKA